MSGPVHREVQKVGQIHLVLEYVLGSKRACLHYDGNWEDLPMRAISEDKAHILTGVKNMLKTSAELGGSFEELSPPYVPPCFAF